MEDWKITRDRKACERPGCPLPSAQSYFAVLEFPACVRRDICDACFCDQERKAESPMVFWRAQRRKSDSKEPVLDLVSLRVLFDKLAAVEDERARQLRYFCALLLLRKRVLKMVQPRTAEQERADLVVVDPKMKELEPISLFAPAIDLDDLSKIKDELLQAMGEDLDGARGEESPKPEVAAQPASEESLAEVAVAVEATEPGAEATNAAEIGASEGSASEDGVSEDSVPEDSASEDSAPESSVPESTEAAAAGEASA